LNAAFSRTGDGGRGGGGIVIITTIY
jgi:hypothetical protein